MKIGDKVYVRRENGSCYEGVIVAKWWIFYRVKYEGLFGITKIDWFTRMGLTLITSADSDDE